MKKISKVERIENTLEVVYDLHVEDNHNYVLSNGLIAHNSGKGFQLENLLGIEGKVFDYKMNERLHRALELKLFEDQKDSIKLTTIISKVVDKETQEKIDVVKSRLIKNHGYCEICATDALNFVASIFAKGDSAKS